MLRARRILETLHLPAHCTAGGPAILSTLDGAELDKIYGAARDLELTPKSIADIGELRARLAEVGKRGYAVDGERISRGLGAPGS